MLCFKPRMIAALILTAAVSPAAHAQRFDALEKHLAAHPSLAVIGYQAEALEEQAIAATALPDPAISIGINNLPIADPGFDRFLPTNKAIGIRQQFPSLTGRRARAEEASAKGAQADALKDATYDALKAQLIGALYIKHRIVAQIALIEQQRGIYSQLGETLEAAISGGQTPVFRLAQVDVDRATLARTGSQLAGEASQIDAQLVDLVGFVPDTAPPALRLPPAPDAPALYHHVKIASIAVDAASAGVKQAKAAWRPEWGAQLTYQQRNAGSGALGDAFAGDDWISAMATFTVPLWANKSQAPRLRAASATQSAAKSQYQAVIRQSEARYASLLAAHRTAMASADALSTQIEAIAARKDAQLRDYEAGRTDYASVLDAYIAVLKLQTQIAAENANAAISIAQMHALLVSP